MNIECTWQSLQLAIFLYTWYTNIVIDSCCVHVKSCIFQLLMNNVNDDDAWDWNLIISLTKCINRHLKQEAPLTLRGQRGRCKNIEEEPQIYGSFLSPRPRPLFLLGVVLRWALANPSCVSNLKSLAAAIVEILKGNSQIFESSLAQGHTHSFSSCDFMMSLGKPQRRVKFEVASPILYRETQNFGVIPWPKAIRTFPLGVILPNLKSLSSSVAEILKGKPQISGSSPSPGKHLLLLCRIWWWALANRSCTLNLKSLASSSTEI